MSDFKPVTLVNAAGDERVATTPAEQVAHEFDGFGTQANVAAVAKARKAEADEAAKVAAAAEKAAGGDAAPAKK